MFDADGGFWFTDTGKFRGRQRDVGSVYYARPDGSLISEVAHPAESPNGIGLSPDGATLYYAETVTGRLRRRRISGPGALEPAEPADRRTLVVGLPGHQMFDSLAVLSDGSIAIGTLLTGCITVVSPDGDTVTQWLRSRRARRPPADQHLLRRPRPHHRVHHPGAHRPARLVPVARARTAAGLPTLSAFPPPT